MDSAGDIDGVNGIGWGTRKEELSGEKCGEVERGVREWATRGTLGGERERLGIRERSGR